MGRARPLALLILLLAAAPALAAEWGGIEPGVSTMAEVRARYGPPSREARTKVEGYDTVQWVYEGAQAPAGMVRMSVEFGLLTPQGYRPSVVRVFHLEPKGRIFNLQAVRAGWGEPDVADTVDGRGRIGYRIGLVVVFDKDENAVIMTFTVPQPSQPPAAAAPRPAQPAPPKR